MTQHVPATARGPLRVLAALLLVDGRYLKAAEIAVSVNPWPCSRQTVWAHWMPALRRAGCQIENHTHYGYRLLDLPPDALLEDVLAMAHALQEEQPTRLWHLMGAEPETTRRARRAA